MANIVNVLVADKEVDKVANMVVNEVADMVVNEVTSLRWPIPGSTWR